MPASFYYRRLIYNLQSHELLLLPKTFLEEREQATCTQSFQTCRDS